MKFPRQAGLCLSSVMLLLATASGCAVDDTGTSSDDVTERSTSSELDAAFAAGLDDIEDDLAAAKGNRCPAPAGVEKKLARTGSLELYAGSRKPTGICAALRPFARLDHPYYFIGGFFSGTAGPGVVGGVDLVWDLENLQAAAFSYKGVVYSSAVALTAGMYEGFGMARSKKASVVDAWSGVFSSGSVSVGLKGIFSADFTAFTGGGVEGVSVGVSGGLTPIPAPVGVTAAPTTEWRAWDAATAKYNSEAWDCVFGKSLRTIRAGGQSVKVVQFGSSRGLAAAILWRAGLTPGGAMAASYAVALGALRSAGVTLSQACPQL